jgi:class 3 adenylate cyclase
MHKGEMSLQRLTLLLAVAVAALTVFVVSAGAITDGQPDGDGHPFVGLMVAQDSGGNPLWRCSGTLLSATVYLTARHCTESPNAHVEIWFALHIDTDSHYVSKAAGGMGCDNPAVTGYPCHGDVGGTPQTHPDYDPDRFFVRDLGVVTLSSPHPSANGVYGDLPEENQLDSYRGRITLLPASVIACFVLLAEAMIGVAVTGERAWHASWWEWHGLIVTAYAVVSYAAHRQWHDERFRGLYLPTTRERVESVSVLFSDLVGFTTFAEKAKPSEVANVLNTYYVVAAPLITRQFGGELEKFIGDGMMATFNGRGDTPDHAVRAAGAALALQRELTALADANPGWPRVRVGVNSGVAVVREMGGDGFVAYVVVGDTVNTASRLESQAPAGGVLIGAETQRALPDGSIVEAVPGLTLKGRQEAVDAYLLRALPS